MIVLQKLFALVVVEMEEFLPKFVAFVSAGGDIRFERNVRRCPVLRCCAEIVCAGIRFVG